MLRCDYMALPWAARLPCSIVRPTRDQTSCPGAFIAIHRRIELTPSQHSPLTVLRGDSLRVVTVAVDRPVIPAGAIVARPSRHLGRVECGARFGLLRAHRGHERLGNRHALSYTLDGVGFRRGLAPGLDQVAVLQLCDFDSAAHSGSCATPILSNLPLTCLRWNAIPWTAL